MYEQGSKESASISSANMTEDFLKAALGAVPGALAVIEVSDFRIKFGNDQFVADFGIDAGNSLMDIIQPEQQDLFRTRTRQINDRSKVGRYIVYKLRTRDGVYKPYYAYISPVLNEHNEVTWYNAQFLPELSKWSLPFTSFESREVYLEQFYEVRFGTFEWYLEEDRLIWSDRMYDIYEVDPSVNLERSLVSRFTHPDDKPAAEAAIEKTLTEDIPLSLEMRIVTARQNVKVVTASAVVVKDDNGKPVKLAGSVKDITAQRRLEEELREKIDELDRSNHELEDFAYVASHDLQEPLRKISTFCSRIAEKYADKLDAEGGMYMERVLASADNMRMLIHNLLEFSRVARDKEPFSEVGLSFALHQAKTDLELLIEDTGATIKADKLPAVTGSLSQLRQLFYNLLTNAIKFRKADIKPVIEISSQELSEREKLRHSLKPAAVYHKIYVKDNGIGFDSQYATRIFQIFQRLHGKSEYPGSGIGLAICKKILEHHHGIIYAESTAGEGATFIFILPEQQS